MHATKGWILNLKEYGRLLRRSWAIIVACTLLGTIAGTGLSLLIRPAYSSDTQLFVAIQSTGSVADLQQGNTFTQARVQTYAETVETPAVLQPVIDELGLETTPAKLAESVKASADLNTVLITISAVSSSPGQAAALAQATADSLVVAVSDLERPGIGEASPVKLSVVTPAVAATEPSSPNLPLNVFVGFIVGLAVGLGIAILRSALDSKVRGEADVSKVTAAPILGGISFDNTARKNPVLSQATPHGPRAESFRQIRTNLQFANVDSSSKTILVTSSLQGEGKSTTATNMAIAMTQAGQRVALIDADLRRPMVATYLGLADGAGLTTALIGTAPVEDLLQPWGDDGLYVLTSGQIPPNPSELLGSEAMSKLLAGLAGDFDAVIIDAPPLIPVTDATVLAQKVDGVVLVVGTGKIRSRDLDKSIAALKLVKANVLGMVLNWLPAKGPDAYVYSYYSRNSKLPRNKKGRRRAAADTGDSPLPGRAGLVNK